MRDLARLGAAALARLAALVAAALALWAAVIVGWLWIASAVQTATGSFGAAVLAFAAGSGATLVAGLRGLARLTRGYQRARVARGLDDTGGFPLEVTLVCTAGVAAAAFALWFLLLAGSPLPSR